MKIFLLFFSLLFFGQAYTQVKFQNLSLNDAIRKAALTDKMVFAQFESETCDECNDVGNKGLSSKEVGDHINKNFIPIKIELKNPDRDNFIAKYNPEQGFGSFFISSNGELIHVYPGTSTNPKDIIKQADLAITKHSEIKTSLIQLDAVWFADPSNYAAMMKSIERRAVLQFNTDSLLEVLVKRLPEDSFKSVSTIRFIAMMAPDIFSNAHKKLFTDMTTFNNAWNSMPGPQRVNINIRRIHKSMQQAISEKSISKALMVASFTKGTYGSSNEAGAKAYEKQMLDYYFGVKDTASYLKVGVTFYDKHYMTVPADSIKKLDSTGMQHLITQANLENKNESGTTVQKKEIRYFPKAQVYSKELNKAAWTFYLFTKEKYYLEKALGWAERAVYFYETPDVLDTYARLLYNTGNRKEGITQQEKAISLLKKESFSYQKYQMVLDEMKKGKDQIATDL